MHAPVLSRKSRVSPSVILTVRVSLAEASDQFARVGPIVAAVLGGISAILLLLLLVWFRRRYNARKVRYRQDHPPTVHWFHSFRAKRRSGSLSSWQKDIEAFPKPPDLVISKPILLSPSSMTFTNPNRPLPTVPAITRASTPKDESEGAPLSRSHSQATWTSHVSTPSVNVDNPSRTKLRVRPDPMLIPGASQLKIPRSDKIVEDGKRNYLVGSTPARGSFQNIAPPPMPSISNTLLQASGSTLRRSRSQSDATSRSNIVTPPTRVSSARPKSRSAWDEFLSLTGSTHAAEASPAGYPSVTFTPSALSPIMGGSTSISRSIRRATSPPHQAVPIRQPSRRELVRSLQETQDAVVALEGLRSGSTIDLPPLTSHSRSFFPVDTNVHLQAEIDILRREVQRLQTLLLAPRPKSFISDDEITSREVNPPPEYSSSSRAIR